MEDVCFVDAGDMPLAATDAPFGREPECEIVEFFSGPTGDPQDVLDLIVVDDGRSVMHRCGIKKPFGRLA